MTIKHVEQKHEYGCVVACIAMILGWDYDEVISEFENDFSKKGTDSEFAKEFICDHGYSVIEKRGSGYIDVREHNKRMMIPFAPIHYVSIQHVIDRPRHTHAIVMDAKGRIYDPGDKSITVAPLCYSVRHVMGFFKT